MVQKPFPEIFLKKMKQWADLRILCQYWRGIWCL